VTPTGKFILFGLAAAVIYIAVTRNHSENSEGKLKHPPSPPGWEELVGCSPLQSFDDTKELDVFEDHTVTMEVKEAKTGKVLSPRKKAGTWAFDELAKRYFITLGEQQKSYALIQPENSEVCMLIFGEQEAANINETWFGRTLEDQNSDMEPPDRY
jgi:hypothetical protein